MKDALKILFIEDSPDDVDLMLIEFQKKNLKLEWTRVQNEKGLINELDKQEWDVILSDYVIPGFSGLEAIKIIRERNKYQPIIVVSGTIGEAIAVETLKAGANDYLMKQNLVRLIPAIERAIDEYKIILKNIQAEQEIITLAHAIRGISDCVSVTDLDNNLLFVNDAFLKTYGYIKEEVIGKNIKMFRSDKTPLKIQKKILPQILGGSWHGELWNKRKDGSDFQISLSTSSIKDETGKLVALLGVAKDITERKRAEQLQKIIYNISQAANIAESLDELIEIIKEQLNLIIDIKNFYVAFYNEDDDTFTFSYMLDEKDDFKTWPAGKTFTAYVFRSQKPKLLTKDEMKRLEKSGEVKFVGTVAKVWMGVPLIVKGKPFGVFAVQNYENENAYNQKDLEMLEFVSHQMSISIERKKAENELKVAYEKAMESDRLKSTFLASMSHELRTPLNAIIGFSDLIKEEFVMDKILDFTGIINRSGRHLLEIVEDIFDVSLLEVGQVGQVNLVKEMHSLHSVMGTIKEMIQAEQLKIKSNIEIIYKPTEDENGIFIYTDKSKFKQIIINLLKNALKFTQNGYIEYGYEKVKYKGDLALRFYVKDTGIGIPKDKQEMIFNIFRQVDEKLSRYYEGTGIGLFVVKRYTEILGGKVDLDSDEGRGSVFYVTLPYLNPKSIQEEEKKESKIHDKTLLSNKTVLIVEDNEVSSMLLKVILNELKINCITAKNGDEAVKNCFENPDIDLVLMDLKMPGMDGYEATKLIKKKRPDLVVIAQTAHAVQGDREEAINAGCDDYISKPIDKNQLLYLVSKSLKGL